MERWQRISINLALYSTAFYLVRFAFSSETKAEAIAIRGHRCQRCGKTNIDLEAHHRLPQKYGGNDEIENLALLCHGCHRIANKNADRGIIYPAVEANRINVINLVKPEKIHIFNRYLRSLTI